MNPMGTSGTKIGSNRPVSAPLFWHEKGWRKYLPRFIANWLLGIRIIIYLRKSDYKITKLNWDGSLEAEYKE